MTFLIHAANVLYLVSYLVKDIFWLRTLTVVAGLTLLAYNLVTPMPFGASAAWNIAFLAINVWQLHLLILERRPVRLEPREQTVYQLAFRTLTPREFARLLRLAVWEKVEPGAVVVRRGEELDRVRVLANGGARVEVDGKPVGALKPGQFIGEMSFLTGQRPSADVVATETSELVSWPKGALRAALEGNADLRAAVQMILGADLAVKLRG